MSDPSPVPEEKPATPAPASGATAAQEAFGKYKARLATAPVAMPVMPGCGMPPSMGALPGYPPGYPYAPQGSGQPHPMGSLTERLGATIRLGFDLFNAALARGASELGGGMGSQQWGGHGHGCGCDHGDRCGYDCCEVIANECCRPGVHGCGYGCC
jgi:hypothetical protein